MESFSLLKNKDFEISSKTKNKLIDRQNPTHPYHLVLQSPLPFLVSFSLLSLITNFVMWLHFDYFKDLQSFFYSFIALAILLGVWFLLMICFLIIKIKKKK